MSNEIDQLYGMSSEIDPLFVVWLRWKYEEAFDRYMDEYKRACAHKTKGAVE